ncbi:Putative cysteine alpha-hairpin motif superfamily, mature-T-Cell Proliferation I type [Colletotrichum destructivum]|uniref:Cx9C motif-containing protein 4, mitochondrial n=1 Tax=Colletotrichum destructivum TaxID=34406 RepID=A0AAX4I4P8_9PEZI|nr:Putative cysteine alpha-hairpin motif superfamily, mature-T-Cell Proliferation I type [Colletotrichum destructivum]
MGLTEDLKANPPCHPRACAIQDCLTRNSFKEDRCQSAIMALYECCEAFYRFKGSQTTTVSCPKPDLLQLKLNRLREELQVAKK